MCLCCYHRELQILLPFDTLLLPLTSDVRLAIACGDRFGLASTDSLRLGHDSRVQVLRKQRRGSIDGTYRNNLMGQDYDSTSHPFPFYSRHGIKNSSHTGVLAESRHVNIGLLSYDFNDHPTSHMIVGMLEILKGQGNHCPYCYFTFFL